MRQRYLEVLRELKELHIEYADVTNAGLEKMPGLMQLETLRLYGTRVTDSGLGDSDSRRSEPRPPPKRLAYPFGVPLFHMSKPAL